MPRKLPPTVFDFKAARKARKYSQHKAAALLHATQPSISRWETDGTMPEIYKMAWLLYWQLEDMKNDTSERGTETSKARPRNGRRPIGTSAKRTRESRKGVEESADEIFQSSASE